MCHTEGKQALEISQAQFNKVASVYYKQLSNEEIKELEKEEIMGLQHMSQSGIKKRALRISKRIQKLVSCMYSHL